MARFNQPEDPSLYNQVTAKNIDDEDFYFKVNRETYSIGAGETRRFPKFMARPLLKHLVDKILIKRDPEGKLLRNQQIRDELGAQIILGEETYEKPVIPTDKELVEKMNRPELDRILERNKSRVAGNEEPTLISSPKAKLEKVKKTLKEDEITRAAKKSVVPTKAPTKEVEEEPEEDFDGLKTEEGDFELPSRDKMLSYAKNTLKMDLEETETKKRIDSLTDEQLYDELGLNDEGSEGII